MHVVRAFGVCEHPLRQRHRCPLPRKHLIAKHLRGGLRLAIAIEDDAMDRRNRFVGARRGEAFDPHQSKPGFAREQLHARDINPRCDADRSSIRRTVGAHRHNDDLVARVERAAICQHKPAVVAATSHALDSSGASARSWSDSVCRLPATSIDMLCHLRGAFSILAPTTTTPDPSARRRTRGPNVAVGNTPIFCDANTGRKGSTEVDALATVCTGTAATFAPPHAKIESKTKAENRVGRIMKTSYQIPGARGLSASARRDFTKNGGFRNENPARNALTIFATEVFTRTRCRPTTRDATTWSGYRGHENRGRRSAIDPTRERKFVRRTRAASQADVARFRLRSHRRTHGTIDRRCRQRGSDQGASADRRGHAREHHSMDFGRRCGARAAREKLQFDDAQWAPFSWRSATSLGAKIAFANDANCFALAEAVFGVGRHAQVLFGVIMGTGVGGGIAFRAPSGLAHVWEGQQSIAGEWGHIALDPKEGPPCYCGKKGCIEQFLSGPSLESKYTQMTGEVMPLAQIAERADAGEICGKGATRGVHRAVCPIDCLHRQRARSVDDRAWRRGLQSSVHLRNQPRGARKMGVLRCCRYADRQAFARRQCGGARGGDVARLNNGNCGLRTYPRCCQRLLFSDGKTVRNLTNWSRAKSSPHTLPPARNPRFCLLDVRRVHSADSPSFRHPELQYLKIQQEVLKRSPL